MIGKVLGLDLGEKTLGVAVSDIMGIIATGVETFRFPDCQFEEALNRVRYFVEKDNIKEIALGLPLHMSGDESDHSRLCRSSTSLRSVNGLFCSGIGLQAKSVYPQELGIYILQGIHFRPI